MRECDQEGGTWAWACCLLCFLSHRCLFSYLEE